MSLSAETEGLYRQLREQGLLSQKTFDELIGSVEKSTSIVVDWEDEGFHWFPAKDNPKWDEEAI